MKWNSYIKQTSSLFGKHFNFCSEVGGTASFTLQLNHIVNCNLSKEKEREKARKLIVTKIL